MDLTSRKRFHRAAAVLGVIGGVLVLVGGVGLALDGGDDEPDRTRAVPASAAERPEPTTPTTSPTTTRPAPSPTTVPVRTRVDTFFAEWAAALRAGDTTFLAARLHPAVLDRYGEAACQTTLGALRLPQASAEVLGTEPALAPWDWTTDGRTTRVDDALGLRLRRTEDGSTFTEADAHVALVDGEVRWFTDCGAPREA